MACARRGLVHLEDPRSLRDEEAVPVNEHDELARLPVERHERSSHLVVANSCLGRGAGGVVEDGGCPEVVSQTVRESDLLRLVAVIAPHHIAGNAEAPHPCLLRIFRQARVLLPNDEKHTTEKVCSVFAVMDTPLEVLKHICGVGFQHCPRPLVGRRIGRWVRRQCSRPAQSDVAPALEPGSRNAAGISCQMRSWACENEKLSRTSGVSTCRSLSGPGTNGCATAWS